MNDGKLLRRGGWRALFGSKAFYSMVLTIVVPIMFQNAISNFVGFLDNIMVGQVGTEPMSGVSIANQLLFVFNQCIFAGMAGAGIFAAQFQGADNTQGVRSCFRYKLYLCIILCGAALSLFWLKGDALIKKCISRMKRQSDGRKRRCNMAMIT